MNKKCRYKKRYHRIIRVIRRHVSNNSHAPRLRASKRVYNSNLFMFSSMLKADNAYTTYMLRAAEHKLFTDNLYKLTTRTGPITYEAAIGL